MKNTLFNYFLNSDGLFKESRRIFEDPKGKDAPGEGGKTIEKAYADLADERNKLRAQLDALQGGKAHQAVLQRHEIARGRAEAQQEIHDRQALIGNLLKKSHDLQTDLQRLSTRVELIDQEVESKARFAGQVNVEGTTENKDQLRKAELTTMKIDAAKAAIEALEHQKGDAKDLDSKRKIDDQITAKKAEIAELEAKLKQEQPVEVSKRLQAEAAALVKRAENLRKQFATMADELRDIEASYKALQAGNEGKLADTKNPKEPKELKRKPKEEIAAGLAAYDERIRARAYGQVKEEAGDGPVDSAKVEERYRKLTGEAATRRAKEQIQKLKGSVGQLNLNLARERYEVDPGSWDISNQEGVVNVADVFINKLGLDPDTVEWMANQFKKGFSADTMAKSDHTLATLLQNPKDNVSKIAGIDPEFAVALNYYMTVKEMVLGQQREHIAGIQNAKQEEPVFNAVIGKGKDVVNGLSKAWEEGDWGAVGLYAAGGYAIYKLWTKYASGNEKMKTALMWGTAVYAGLYVFAPEQASKLFNKGAMRSIKGTALENLKGCVGENGLKTVLELTAAAQVKDARVKDVFGAMSADSSDAKSRQFEMIQLNTPGIARCFPALAVLGPLYPDSKKHLSPEEKLYIETAKGLYRNAKGLREAWQANVQPTEGISFDQQFLSENSPDYTMEHLYNALVPHAGNFREQIWDKGLEDRARTDLTKVFEKDKLNIKKSVGNRLNATIKDFPVVIKSVYNAATDKNQYKFYLANKADKGDLEVAAITMGDADSEAMGHKAVIEAIDARMKDLVAQVKITGDSEVKDVKYDESRGIWVGKQTVAADPNKGVPASEGEIKLTPYEDGKNAKFEFPGGTIIVAGDKIGGDNAKAGPILTQLMLQPEFNVLNVFYYNREVEYEDPDPKGNQFVLKFGKDKKVAVRFKYEGNKYHINLADEAKLLSSDEFANAYAEARGRGEDFKVFDRINDAIKYGMPENYVIFFFQGLSHWATDAAYDNLTRGVSADLMSGSIPNYFTETLLASKKALLIGILKRNIKGVTSLKDLKNAETDVKSRLMELETLFTEIKRLKPESGTTFGRGEFVQKVIDPLRESGLRSKTYKFAYKQFESAIMSDGDLKGSDLSKRIHEITGKLLGVFAYYTAYLDTSDLDTLDSTGRISEDARRKMVYFNYVRDQIVWKKREFFRGLGKSYSSLPGAGAQQWDIDEFKTWSKSSKANAVDLDPMALEPALTYDEGKPDVAGLKAGERPKRLVTALYLKYMNVVDELKKRKGANWTSMDAELTKYSKSQLLWEAKNINATAVTRQAQELAMGMAAEKFRNHLIDAGTKDSPYWNPGISIADRFRKLFR